MTLQDAALASLKGTGSLLKDRQAQPPKMLKRQVGYNQHSDTHAKKRNTGDNDMVIN